MLLERVLWARHCSKHSIALARFILTVLFGGPYVQSLLQRSKLRHREVKQLA